MKQQTPSNASIASPETLLPRIEHLLNVDAPRYRRFWAYYRNPLTAINVPNTDAGSARPYRQAMEWGLPSRITGVRSGTEIGCGTNHDMVQRKEVVIENDIAWRLDTMVDYLFGKPIILNSTASDPSRREIIQQLVRLIIAQAGGITFLQQLSLLGAVYGFVDVLVKLAPESCEDQSTCNTKDLGELNQSTGAESEEVPAQAEHAMREDDTPSIPGSSHPSLKALAALARRIRLEIVEPSRALPLLSCDDWRKLDGYAQVWKEPDSDKRDVPSSSQSHWFERLRNIVSPRLAAVRSTADASSDLNIELITSDNWKRFKGNKLTSSGTNSLGQIPIVHIQNLALPFEYAGASEVEALIPIQDEINTRLCDRGYRITMQSFKMYVGIGIDNFNDQPVSPGQMWMTDNENAKILEFGGDGKTFSEDNQIGEMREAMDKISGVTPIVAGALKGRIGRLTSAAALRVTMLALLAKTERKRTTYGNGILRICELALAWLDRAGLFHTTTDERQFEIHWPSPLPVNDLERLEEAQAKLKVGVPSDAVLRELGYSPSPLAGEGRGEG